MEPDMWNIYMLVFSSAVLPAPSPCSFTTLLLKANFLTASVNVLLNSFYPAV